MKITLDDTTLERIIHYETEAGMSTMEMLRKLRENDLIEDDFQFLDFSLEQWVDALSEVALFLCQVHRLL